MLAIQDTTEFNLTHLHATEGLGPCTGGNERGFLMHSLLALSPGGLTVPLCSNKTGSTQHWGTCLRRSVTRIPRSPSGSAGVASDTNGKNELGHLTPLSTKDGNGAQSK